MMHKAWRSIEEVPHCFSRSSIKFEGYMGKKMDDSIQILSKITRSVADIKSLRFALFKIIRQISRSMLFFFWRVGMIPSLLYSPDYFTVSTLCILI